MLLSLHVKNLALIDETEVLFKPGLNILTGETGAGKSVLIGSINLALGAKAEKEIIRTGAESAFVELLFEAEGEPVKRKLEELELPVEDGTVCISRRILPARSVFRINGETVSARQVKELAEFLLDIHGQHEHQSLLHKKKHLEILDAYAGEKLAKIRTELAESCHAYRKAERELENARMDEEEKRRTLALAEFETGEIAGAALSPGEDERLEQDYRKFSNLKRIGEAMSASLYLTGNDGENAAGAVIARALRELRSVSSFDPKLLEIEEQLSEVDSLLNDFNRSAADYMEELDVDPSAFVQTEERLNQINHLKGKYGNTIEAILEYGKKQQELLDKLADYETYIQKLEQDSKQQKERFYECCERASKIRKTAAKALAAKLRGALEELSFLSVQFEIRVEPREEAGADGYDDVEFLISTNPGEKLRPLSQVASGGELSRVMLAIKTVLAEKDSVDTLIFDEIDAGISGRTAWQVSRQLGILGKAHQVISITHLPQIAAMADTHFLIEKSSDGKSTVTRITNLSEEESIQEVARLLGSGSITDAAVQNAMEMKKLAKESK